MMLCASNYTSSGQRINDNYNFRENYLDYFYLRSLGGAASGYSLVSMVRLYGLGLGFGTYIVTTINHKLV